MCVCASSYIYWRMHARTAHKTLAQNRLLPVIWKRTYLITICNQWIRYLYSRNAARIIRDCNTCKPREQRRRYAMENLQLREATRAATRGNTCGYARVQKGYGVRGSKQHRCFGKTTPYKWQNNAVVFWGTFRITCKYLYLVYKEKKVGVHFERSDRSDRSGRSTGVTDGGS